MSLFHGDDQQSKSDSYQDQAIEVEVELEAEPRAGRPNFLTTVRFEDFDLPHEVLAGLDSAGFEYATPIQAQAIPVALKGYDIAGQAQTGTGKTTAFLVPLIFRLMKNKALAPDLPRAIVMTPTRELAMQIYEDTLLLCKETSLRVALIIGGMEYKEQADVLGTNPEIIICTPGRIIDYLQQKIFKPEAVEVAVVDEADRLLDMGFIKDLKYLLSKLPPFSQRQTMLFSATLDDRVLELTYEFMNPPQFITAEPDNSDKASIEQELYHVARDEKLPLLLGLLRRDEHQRIVIFRNTKSGVEWLAKKLTLNGFQAEGITGDLPQGKRLKLMESFKENRLQILVATDVASRGIHVDDVSHVYNFDLPQDAENYVHRIGRTARAGKTGKAISFACEDYVFHLEAIENLLGEKIPVVWATEDLFHEDKAGEVNVKTKRGERERKSSGSDRRPARGESHSFSRGPAKSSRPGGIFGLAPQNPAVSESDDPRQALNWVDGAVVSLETGEQTSAPSDINAHKQQSADKDSSSRRRNKRRRDRRNFSAHHDVAEVQSTDAAVNVDGGVRGTDGDSKPDSANAKEFISLKVEAKASEVKFAEEASRVSKSDEAGKDLAAASDEKPALKKMSSKAKITKEKPSNVQVKEQLKQKDNLALESGKSKKTAEAAPAKEKVSKGKETAVEQAETGKKTAAKTKKTSSLTEAKSNDSKEASTTKTKTTKSAGSVKRAASKKDALAQEDQDTQKTNVTSSCSVAASAVKAVNKKSDGGTKAKEKKTTQTVAAEAAEAAAKKNTPTAAKATKATEKTVKATNAVKVENKPKAPSKNTSASKVKDAKKTEIAGKASKISSTEASKSSVKNTAKKSVTPLQTVEEKKDETAQTPVKRVVRKNVEAIKTNEKKANEAPDKTTSKRTKTETATSDAKGKVSKESKSKDDIKSTGKIATAETTNSSAKKTTRVKKATENNAASTEETSKGVAKAPAKTKTTKKPTAKNSTPKSE